MPECICPIDHRTIPAKQRIEVFMPTENVIYVLSALCPVHGYHEVVLDASTPATTQCQQESTCDDTSSDVDTN